MIIDPVTTTPSVITAPAALTIAIVTNGTFDNTLSLATSDTTTPTIPTVPAPLDKLSIVQILQGLLIISQSLVNQLFSAPKAPATPAIAHASQTTEKPPMITSTTKPNGVPREETLKELRQLYLNDPLAFFHLLMGLPPKTTPSPTTTTTIRTRPPWPEPDCGNPRLSNWLRRVFLNTHNTLRGSVARGQTEKSMGWGVAPPATIIYRMAMATWWSQLARFGMRSNMMFYYSEYSRGGNNVLSWSKMAWWNNIYLGCAVQHCGSTYYTACMYKPGGNNINHYVYKVGRVCSDCPVGQCDYQALCRW
ncbi:hypothetical protein ANCCAN_06165 [Ancylostoma caninum]|uniref:SCP domain-containing protein n=1 Tax=Ancylostoma caninum TaxID=29170 RepID=A0A368GW72_ANCCA|nr:hypothetical protein ANCCAN_06165 [Ancylostoma caninum]